MKEKVPKCIRRVGGDLLCICCYTKCIKWGKSASGTQRFKCNECKTTVVEAYRYKAYLPGINNKIINFLKEGCGILSISRLTHISATTVQQRILQIASRISRPTVSFHKTYEVDELCTFIGKKTNLRWIAYAVRRDNRQVVDFRVGKRTNKTLKPVIETLELSEATRIYTDKLKNYASLIDQAIHSTKLRCTNYIERKNLTIRTHLKRLSRRTICYSKSLLMLTACLRIYFWG